MTKKIIRIFIFAASVLLSASLSVAQNVPPLPVDPSVTYGVLPDNISYYIVSNPTDKGFADFSLVWRLGTPERKDTAALSSCPERTAVSKDEALRIARKALAGTSLFSSRTPDRFLRDNGVQGSSCGYIEMKDSALVFRFSNVNLNRGESFLDSLFLLAFDLVREYSVTVHKKGASDCGQAIIVSGDIDRNAIYSKIRLMSFFVPDIGPEEPSYDYKWCPADSLKCISVTDRDGKTASVTAEYSFPRIPREYMGTALPAVSEQMGQELGMILEARLRKGLYEEGIPVSDVGYRFTGSSQWSGDEKYTVRVNAAREDVPDVIAVLSSVLSQLSAGGITLKEYAQVKKAVGRHLGYQARTYVKNNSENIDRCISSFLYGTALASPAERYSFFEASGLPDSAGLRYFNRFVSSLVDSTGNMTLTCVSDSSEVTDIGMKEIFRRSWNDTSCVLTPHVSSYSDTAAFDILPGKCKISRTRKESMSGGTVWTFSNGMKVVYKHLPAGGRFWYSLVLKKGFSSVPDLEPGQGAFFSDILGLYKVAGMKHDDFDSLLSAMDIVMERNVGPVDMSLSGNAASGSLEFLLKSLVSISKDSAADSAAFDYYLKCEKLKLQETGGVEERLVAIDSIISPDFRYSRFKAPSRLTRDLLHVSDSYFRNQFERINDGVLVLVGDLDEFALKKTLQEYVGSFPVSKRMLPVRVQGAELVSGGSTYTVNGRETSLDVVMSVPARLDIQSYMASEMAAMALYDAAVASMAGMAASLNVSGNFSTVPSERLNIAVSVDACDTAYFAEGVTGMKPVRALFALRSVLRTLSMENLPQSMLDTYKSTLKNAISSRSNDPDYWVEAVSRRFIYGKDFHTDYSGKIDAVTADNVREIIYSLDNGAKVEYIVRPKRKTK